MSFAGRFAREGRGSSVLTRTSASLPGSLDQLSLSSQQRKNARDCFADPIARMHAVVDCAQGRNRGYFERVVAEHGAKCPHEWVDALTF
jgi:hypothetical protein